MFSRAISTSATRFGRKSKSFTLNILYPHWDTPISHTFKDEKDLADFLKQPPQFLRDPETNKSIRHNNVKQINPNIIYDIAGSGIPYREKGLSQEQIWDKVFEGKTATALKNVLEKEGLVVELPRVVKDVQGKDVSEWEAVYQLADGCVVFLEAKYRMSKVNIDDQLKRVTRSLRIMRCTGSRAKLFLAAYHWPSDDNSIAYARSKGYGIIRPNGSDLDVSVMAEGE